MGCERDLWKRAHCILSFFSSCNLHILTTRSFVCCSDLSLSPLNCLMDLVSKVVHASLLHICNGTYQIFMHFASSWNVTFYAYFFSSLSCSLVLSLSTLSLCLALSICRFRRRFHRRRARNCFWFISEICAHVRGCDGIYMAVGKIAWKLLWSKPN